MGQTLDQLSRKPRHVESSREPGLVRTPFFEEAQPDFPRASSLNRRRVEKQRLSAQWTWKMMMPSCMERKPLLRLLHKPPFRARRRRPRRPLRAQKRMVSLAVPPEQVQVDCLRLWQREWSSLSHTEDLLLLFPLSLSLTRGMSDSCIQE
ncbi:hypothetical protein BD324DRAFT_417121 [Kockovaella imperatae]|uniref:Uncharacterized protein n=1 Tax=Kockovaella imperatae TaxID=4999 RepID=A0A1Y1UKF9_9TREE|nr:hypothetical protein BD324DRAFT_417121 [Kockovaella imperatae]ORX38027.1 hypothetical protein BD324DRAFT_417121 [Kockovaella imperatae]